MATTKCFNRLPRIFLGVVAVLGVSTASAEPWPFERGWDGEYQRLRFEVSWLFISAGESMIQAWRPAPGEVAFRTEACSNSKVDMIHKVRDQALARATYGPEGLAPSFYRLTQYDSGDWKDITTRYGDTVVTRKHHKDKEFRFEEVPSGSLDAVSALFALRRKALEVGERYKVPVFDEKEGYELVAKVLRRERIETPFGKRTPTVVVKPELKTEGIFRRKGAMWIWFTDDASHVPVRMESEVAFGSVDAQLVAIESEPPPGGPEEPFCMPELGPPGQPR